MASNLYGIKQSSKTKPKDISSSSSLAFSSNLSALISKSTIPSAKPSSTLSFPATTTTTTTTGRPRPSKTKENIFTSHNKNVKKRSAADLEAAESEDQHNAGSQKHKTSSTLDSVSTSELHRSKRKMEEKVRLYNAMKRGEYVPRHGEDHDDNRAGSLVDFDRKWAESQTTQQHHDDNDGSSDSDNTSTTSSTHSNPNSREELVPYTDEFGRVLHLPRRTAERKTRQARIAQLAAEEAIEMSARPRMPEKIIYGDAVQREAFNPDTVVAERMAALAKKRDRSLTPPPDTHFDAGQEVRTKGTGFYAFSQDQNERKREMDGLERQREETERVRKENEENREDVRQKRKREIEERRKLVAEQRARNLADRFLDGLDVGDVVGGGGSSAISGEKEVVGDES